MKKWYLYNKKADFKAIAERFGIDQVTARILRNRDIVEDRDIDRFLNGTLEDLYSPMLLPDAIRCMNQLERAVNEGRRIRIVGDYDVDGVMATYILYRGLTRLSAKVDYEIPDRIRDGYGINTEIVDRAAKDGIQLILTCDNGISAIEELRHARELGITVLVTDHHDLRKTPPEAGGRDILPPASAVVDPKRADSRYPFSEICGAVVAWKIIQLLYQKKNLPPGEGGEFLPFAAIATVCDVVRLRDENRIIVKHGLESIPETENPGLKALLKAQGLSEQERISAYHAGFVIGPCINAGGRLESAKTALRLFLSESEEEACSLAARLKELNDARKDMTKQACEMAFRAVSEHYLRDRVLVVYLPALHESLAGIVAGRVRERFYRPAFVITDAAPEGAEAGVPGRPMAKGSGRSIEGYPMSDRLAELSHLLTKFGGHPMAAGFSLPRENIDIFRKELNARCALTEEQLQEKLWIDVPMPIDYVKESLVEDFEKLEPFGAGNERPLFACKNLLIQDARVMGRNRNAVKLRLLSSGRTQMEGVIFLDGDAFLREKGANSLIDIVYYPSINEYNGTRSLQLVIKEYQLHR